MRKLGKRMKKWKWVIAPIVLLLLLYAVEYVQSNRYLVLNSIIDFDKQIDIPKLEDGWIPQGISKTEDYLFVSAYDPEMEEGENGKGGQPSVLFVMDNETHEHVKTLNFEGEVDGEVIDLRSHFGAIDYAKENNTMYLADSTNEILWAVSMEDMNAVIEEDGGAGKVKAEKALVEREVIASFLTYHNGLLYVGQHDPDSKSDNFMIGYDLDSQEAKTDKIPLPLKSQGVTFMDYQDQLYLLTSSSRGVDNPSILVAEKVEETTNEEDHVVLEKEVEQELALPNMSEDLYADGETVYICFESAAKYYNDKPFSFLFTEKRHILATTMEAILEQ